MSRRVLRSLPYFLRQKRPPSIHSPKSLLSGERTSCQPTHQRHPGTHSRASRAKACARPSSWRSGNRPCGSAQLVSLPRPTWATAAYPQALLNSTRTRHRTPHAGLRRDRSVCTKPPARARTRTGGRTEALVGACGPCIARYGHRGEPDDRRRARDRTRRLPQSRDCAHKRVWADMSQKGKATVVAELMEKDGGGVAMVRVGPPFDSRTC